MIFNENGEMITIEHPCVYIGESVFDFKILREALDTLDETEYKALILDIEDEIKQCDQKYLNKLNAIKQVDLLSKKSRRLISIWSGITGAGTVGSFIGAAVTVANHAKLSIALLIISGFLFTAMIILLSILANDDGKREKICMDIVKLAKEVVEFYEQQIIDTRIPQRVRNEILIKLHSLKSKVDKVSEHLNNVRIQRELNNIRFNQQMQQMQIMNQNLQQQQQMQQLNDQINQMNFNMINQQAVQQANGFGMGMY